MSDFKKLSAFENVPCEWFCLSTYDNEVNQLKDENIKLRALCRDMYLIVGILDARGARLQLHGKTADWRTLEERYEALMGEGCHDENRL